MKRYCISCHRAGKENRNYLMDTYDNILNSGDEAPVVEAGDLESILLTTLQGTPVMDPNDPTVELVSQMPPNKLLKDNVIDVFVRWVMAGMPNTAADAALIPTPTPQPTATPEGFTGTSVPETTPVFTPTRSARHGLLCAAYIAHLRFHAIDFPRNGCTWALQVPRVHRRLPRLVLFKSLFSCRRLW